MNPIRSMLLAPAIALALWAVTAQANTDEAIAERITAAAAKLGAVLRG